MASLYFAKKNTAWYLPIKLFPQSSSPTEWIASPTLATGDFKRVGYDSTGTVTLSNGNLTTTPSVSPSSSGWVLLSLSTTEMNNDIVCIDWKDASGAEWASGGLIIMTTADAVDDLATITDVLNVNVQQISGDSGAADNAESFFDGTGYAGTNNVIPTVVNLTNAPTSGDLTATMKSSVTTAATASTPTAAAVTGNVGGSVASVTAPVTVGTNSDKTGYSLATTPPTAAQIRTEIDSNSTQLAKLGAPAGASMSADIAAVKAETASIQTDTNDLQTQIGSAGAGLTSVASASALTTVGNNVASILADTGTDGVVLSTAQMQLLADIVLGRSVSSINSSASTHSLYELIQAILESNASSGSWVIYKTDGSSVFNTRTLTTDAEAVPIVGVS